MPITPQQKQWLERFCKANRYQLDREQSKNGIVVFKKPIGNNMIAQIAYGAGALTTRFYLVAARQPFKGDQTIPWMMIGEGMSAAWDEVFNKVTGCGLDELKKVE